jgi:hypothetical protein
MNLWHKTGVVDQDYLSFKRLHKRIIELVSKKLGRTFTHYDVEHVLWFKGGNDVST